MEWQPIETAPKDGSDLLLWIGEPIIGWWDGGSEKISGRWSTSPWSADAKPTHWMPLPAPPESES